ncbi:serine/threonine-protein phosphatase 1 regulatory subunit 10 [Anastrepha ludens]|uniref:serine/threonine-protein phosphatase 1 regulatory subunit 10 n=1 Tax=Anastrepha ludens TaxID=28586 RepID=UPI0023B0CDC9|nr:serine/threonine-protein phosphatase 1 regulatory subunit 10 [Anastrepha ludens]XP_053960748.1 serine/threonine-protein phosphatase 1 regulatory subunit 10 [Anastrepha ludens]XP_053960749.1 serine/threonine-protein phosphatase 1 regulatory subunit 10 [Anastrepha ludens]XP_053960750.1 serine/threonine-protein phosphatase 1 regulatory subunit 10 [Anastrepha ludens]
MPRIVPLQLLKCLKVLLDDNGGILSIGEVKRIAGLMNRYSKKLVSKCIYVQILKVTKTELLGEFMGVGGWSLVYNWLNDAIRAMNWPLVQEILELLLLCPVDVDRLKINSAPKLVKGLCRDGGNEGVRILAKRLVEQWLKVVTENTSVSQVENIQQQAVSNVSATTVVQATPIVRQEPKMIPPSADSIKIRSPVVVRRASSNAVEEDPLADVADMPPEPSTYAPTSAQKKASETGLVFKLVYKDGQQVLAKVPKTAQVTAVVEEEENETNNEEGADENADAEVGVVTDAGGEVEADTEMDDPEAEEEVDSHTAAPVVEEEEDTRTSLDKADKESESSADDEAQTTQDADKMQSAEKPLDRKKSIDNESEKPTNKEQKLSIESKESKNKDKDIKTDKERLKDRKSSSSSSSHKSSSHKSKSSSSKSKSSSSSSSHRSSSDKHRSDKDRSSSSKDKDRKEGSSSSSSSSKHRSSSSSKSSSSTSSKDRHRDKDKEKSANTSSSSLSSSSHKKDKEREKETQAEKDKDNAVKPSTPSMDKLGRIPKKPKDESESDAVKPTSITIPSKKASMSIEIRRDSEKAKTVKTYKSQFRSHGLTEEAPPPPSRKGLKKPASTTSAPGTVIPTSLPSSLKRPSPPPSSSDSPTQKKSKIDINNLTVANEKPGAIKLIAPKKIQTLVETNLFSDALSAATGPKKVTKRKRPTTPGPGQTKEGHSPPTSPDAPKVAPLKFYQDTLDEPKADEKSDKENDAQESEKSEDLDAGDKGNSTEDDDDIPLKKVKEDIEQKVLREQKAADESGVTSSAATGGSVDITGSDAEEEAVTKEATSKEVEEEETRKVPGPGCGPNGPPGVLMLHRRKGPKKKLSWRPQEHLEQIRYFELDETERVNVTKTQSFMDMKNLERYSERDAINIARRGFTHEDNMRPQTDWRPLIEVDGVPPHPNGNQSKQRKVQTEREQTTLRALYFSHSMIPDSPAEAELEPHFAYDVPVIPLEDITGNPDAVSDYTNMPWPEPKSSPKYPENTVTSAGKLTNVPVNTLPPNNVNAFPSFMPQYGATSANNMLAAQMQITRPVPAVAAVAAAAAVGGGPHPGWQQGGANFNGPLGGPMGPMAGPAVPQQNLLGPFGPPAGNAQWQMHGGQYGGPQGPFNNAPNFGPMGMMAPRIMANMAAANAFERNNMNNNHHNNNNQNRNNNGGNWRTGSNFQDNSGGGNWRSGGGGGGQNRGGGGGGSNNGVCKAFMRGHCRLGKSCKFIHPKSKRI